MVGDTLFCSTFNGFGNLSLVDNCCAGFSPGSDNAVLFRSEFIHVRGILNIENIQMTLRHFHTYRK